MRQSRRKTSPARQALSEQLRALIQAQGWTAYALGQAAQVDRSIITRFLARESGLSLDSLDRIAAVMRVRLAEVGKKGTRRTERREEAQQAAPTDQVS